MKYIVYFEVFGKKMKTVVEANSDIEAKLKVRDRMVFHKVTEHRETTMWDNFIEVYNNLKRFI